MQFQVYGDGSLQLLFDATETDSQIEILTSILNNPNISIKGNDTDNLLNMLQFMRAMGRTGTKH